LVQSWCKVGAKLVPSWCQVGAKLVPSWCEVGAKLVPSWCQVLGSFSCKCEVKGEKTWHQLGTNLAPTLHQLGTNFAPNFLSIMSQIKMAHDPMLQKKLKEMKYCVVGFCQKYNQIVFFLSDYLKI